MRHATRSTLFFSLLCVAGMGAAVGCHGAAGRPPVQTERIPVVGGSVMEESFYVKNGKRVLHGTQRSWFKDGQRRRQTEYVDGLPQGHMTEWYKSGNKAKEGMYKNGMPVGLWQGWWDRTGYKSWEATFDSEGLGLIQRETFFWHTDGTIRADGSFRKGRKHGTWTYWNENGTIRVQGEWRDGEPWEGVCGVPAPEGPGNWQGLLIFKKYHEGQPTGKMLDALPQPSRGN